MYKLCNLVQCSCTAGDSWRTDLARLVSDQQDDKHNNVGGVVSMKIEALGVREKVRELDRQKDLNCSF